MSSNISTISTLKSTFSHLRFKEAADFYWSSAKQTVFYAPLTSGQDICVLLHETAHALLEHNDFENDLELLAREREAWNYASEVLAHLCHIIIDTELIEDHLDTYRDWLHRRSLCPRCAETGLQTKTSTYQCINCECSWMVNDARQCQLRRKIMHTTLR